MSDPNRGESEERYQQLIRTSPAPINLFDASGQVIWGNDAVVDLLGLDSKDELIGTSIFEYISSDDEDTARRELAEVVAKKQSVGPTSMTLERVDGEERHIRVSTAPGRYQGQDIGQAVVIDVTPLHEVQEELEAQREFIEDALDTLEDVFYVVDPDGALQQWNDTLQEVSGYTAGELQGKPVADFFVESDREEVIESIDTALEDGSDVLEATARTRTGAEIPFEFRKRRLIDDDEVLGVVGIGRDVSSRTVRDQHIQTVDYLLKHNLRNQLNVILAATSLIESATEAADRTQFERIEGAGERLLSIFEDHHQVVRLLTSQESRRPIHLADLLEKVVASLAQRYPSATITAESPEGVVVTADPMLEQAINTLVETLLDNAEDAEPTVSITVEPSDSTAAIRLEDEGPAIQDIEYGSIEDATKLSSTFHPTKLGLWFVYLVVRQSRGSLTVEPADGDGNVVSMTLNRHRESGTPGA